MTNLFSTGSLPGFSVARGGFIGDMIGWFIRVAIYDICISGISDILGVSRIAAIFIFLGILGLISLGGYILRQKMAPRADS